MKKLTLLLFAMLMATPFFAQGTIEFCGVPVDGHVDNFVPKMEQLGYSTMVGGEDHTFMIGETAGKYTELVVYYTPKTKTVWAVCPAIEGDGSWSGLKKMYNEYKEMCISQYQGYKVYTWDTFEAPYKEGDGNEMKAIEEEKCNYRTELHGSNGRITVCITRDAFLTIGYMNLKNSALNEAEVEEMKTAPFAQDHLEFCGVPVDGHVDNFVGKMTQLGYTETYRNDRGVSMTGKYMGKDADLAIFCTSKSQTAHSVWVSFEESTNWSELKGLYLELKGACIKKYEGYKVEIREQFDAPYREGSGYEMEGVRKGKCLYRTTLTGDKGKITLLVDIDEKVLLIYDDLKNEALSEAEEEEMATASSAQGPVEFCGVPVDGHVDNFVAKMEQLGYTETRRVNDWVIMTGKFTGRNVELYVGYTPKTKNVHAVMPRFEESTNWADLKKMYFEQKEVHMKKNEGYEVQCTETFKEPYKEGNGNEMRAVKEEKCDYCTYFIGHTSVMSVFIASDCRLVLIFRNLINLALNEAESNE